VIFASQVHSLTQVLSLSLVLHSRFPTWTKLSRASAPSTTGPWHILYSIFWLSLRNCIINMSHLTQGPSCSTQNSQQADIADRILFFTRHRSPPLDPVDQAAPIGIPTVIQTLAFPVPLLDSPTEEVFLHMPNLFCLEEDQGFLTMIHQPVFQTPGCKNLKLLAESTGELATKSSVTNNYMHYQNQLMDTLRAMTDHLAMLSVPPAPPAPSKSKSRVKPQNPTHLTVPTQASLTHSCSNTACTSFSAAKTSWMTPTRWHSCFLTWRALRLTGSRMRSPMAHLASCLLLG